MRRSGRLSLVVAATATLSISCSDSAALTAPDDGAGSIAAAKLGQSADLQSASGSGHYHTQDGLWRTFSFNGTKKPNGTVTGRFHFRIHDAQGAGSRIWGDVTCLTIEGNRAWLGGYVTKAGNPNHIGRAHGFSVVDNGQGQGAAADQVTVTWPGSSNPPFDEPDEYCESKPDQQLHLVEAGNVQVRP